MIGDFFNSISIKFRKENDLSDITWAMCQSCDSFRNAFLRFFFTDFDISVDVTIEREKSEDDSRPDFVITSNGETYIIENKIYDTNHHFGQYDNAFNVTPKKIGYITNYRINDKEIISKGYPIRTWEQLYDTFISSLPENDEDNKLWKGYLCYVKNVCNIIKIETPMRLDGIYSLYSLMEILKKLSTRNEQDFELIKYNELKASGNGSYNGVTGVNFEIKYKSIEQNSGIWGWIGIYYERVKPLIIMGFYNNSNWGKGFCDMILPYASKWSNQKYFSKPYIEDSQIWFELTPEYHEVFNSLEDAKQQEEILKNFMDEVLHYPIILKQ